MEKNIKRFSIALIITTVIVYLVFLIGVLVSYDESLATLSKISVNVFFVLSVIELGLFMILTTMSMIALCKKIISGSLPKKKSAEKFPTKWLVFGMISFVAFFYLFNVLSSVA